MKVLLAGGGTGGHINPALAIASIIQSHEPSAEFLFVGTPHGMESRLIPAAGYPYASMEVAGFQRRLSLKNIRRNLEATYFLVTSQPHAREILRSFSPDIAIGTGGYVSGPILHAAAHMGIPTVIHEQNAYPGVTTRILSREVGHVMLSVKQTLRYLRPSCPCTITGLPVRGGIAKISREEARQKLGFDDHMCILSFGGSLGAGCINNAIAKVIPWHVQNDLQLNHIHGYGKNGAGIIPKVMAAENIPLRSKRLRITEYIDDMDVCLAAADLVISRSGASTLAELEAAGRGAILIPSPNVAAHHQSYNAHVLGDAGAAVVIEEENATPRRVIEEILALYKDRARLQDMGSRAKALEIPDTPDRIWHVLEGLLG